MERDGFYYEVSTVVKKLKILLRICFICYDHLKTFFTVYWKLFTWKLMLPKSGYLPIRRPYRTLHLGHQGSIKKTTTTKTLTISIRTFLLILSNKDIFLLKELYNWNKSTLFDILNRICDITELTMTTKIIYLLRFIVNPWYYRINNKSKELLIC